MEVRWVKKSFKYQALLVPLFVALFVWQDVFGKGSDHLVVNEIQYEDSEGNSKHDFVEIYNPTDHDIDLGNFNLSKMTSSGKTYGIKSPLANKGTMLKSKSFYVWASTADSEYAKSIKADIATSETLANNNAVAIINRSDSSVVDGVCWGTLDASKIDYCEKNSFVSSFVKASMGRIDGADSDDNPADFFVLKNSSPGKENVKLEEEKKEEDKTETKPKEYPTGISITELFPNPFQSQYEEYVELYNGTNEDVDLLGWTLHDASKSGKYTFLESVVIKAKKYLAIFKKDFKFALNNSGNESVTLFDPNGKEIANAIYDGSQKNASYNFDGSNWRWSKFLTPGGENILNNQPFGTVEIDNEVFAGAYADFAIATGDLDGDKVKISWDFGDGHKSYLAKTRHKYEKVGTYQASVKLSDGSEDVLKNFTVEVEEFPYPEIKIIAINANPDGSDTGAESITVQNKSKKKINLLGWSIATGWKKFINHPIKEDVVIKQNAVQELTHDVASFALNNTKAKIQLRYPDGKVAHEVKYKSPNKTIAEGEKYVKEKGGWAWVLSQKSIKSEKQEEANQLEVSGQQSTEMKDMEEENISSAVSSEQSSDHNEKGGEIAGAETVKKEIAMFRKNDLKNIKLSEFEPQVLGAETIRIIDGQYFFTSQNVEQEHYALSFLKNIASYLNTKLNLLLNFFFQ